MELLIAAQLPFGEIWNVMDPKVSVARPAWLEHTEKSLFQMASVQLTSCPLVCTSQFSKLMRALADGPQAYYRIDQKILRTIVNEYLKFRIDYLE
eukprot:6444177-Amphidinium_carterae.1